MSFLAAASFFGALGLAYLGPVDGHDFDALDDLLRVADAISGPVVVHVHTVKGRGYAPAEHDPEKCLHDVGPFDPSTGASRRPPTLSYTQAFGRAMVTAGERDPSLEHFAAELTDAAYRVALWHGVGDKWLDLQLDLWGALTQAVEKRSSRR